MKLEMLLFLQQYYQFCEYISRQGGMEMKKHLLTIRNSDIFSGISNEEIGSLLEEIPVKYQTYRKGNFIFYAGDKVYYIYIVLIGVVHIIQEDYWGNRNILRQVRPGGMFGEAFACLPDSTATVSVMAVEDTKVLCIDVSQFLLASHVMTPPQGAFMLNLMAVMARRNCQLTQKIRYITQRSTRQKIMFYLSDEALRQHSNSFTLPFNRQQMADFLSVDRSAMSAELSRMKRDGLLDYTKDQFVLKQRHERKGPA